MYIIMKYVNENICILELACSLECKLKPVEYIYLIVIHHISD